MFRVYYKAEMMKGLNGFNILALAIYLLKLNNQSENDMLIFRDFNV